jgi:putative transposase
MPRRPRNETEPGVYHVFARGNDRRTIFVDDIDRELYMRLLGQGTMHRKWRTLAYCLMTNHVHLVIETVVPNLSAGMQRLQGEYAQRFNRRHGTTGHVFERRFGATTITNDVHLQTAVAYVASNPVEADVCDRPETWRWGSHATIVGTGTPRPHWLDVSRLLEYFGAAGGDPLERYARFVAERREARAVAPGPLGERLGQLATPAGDCERIHSRRVSSPTRA